MNRQELLFDARCLGSGIGVHATNLLNGLRLQHHDLRLRAITAPEHQSALVSICDDVVVVKAPIYSVREQFEMPWASRGSRLLHVLHYNAPLLFQGVLLVSIYDLTHILDETYRRTWKSKLYASPMLHLVSRRANHIFTLSEYSKGQICAQLGISESKVTVTSCGVGPQFSPDNQEDAAAQVRESIGVSGPFILFVGNLKPHKNILNLLRAFAVLTAGKESDCNLLILGDDSKWKSALTKEAQKLGIAGRVYFINHVSETLLPKVYAAAKVLVLPSFEEGFGLPVLEAMAIGTPVVCSQAASLPEVGGNAVRYFNPHDPEEIANCIASVVNSPEVQLEMRLKGIARAKQFTWSQCVHRHYAIYRRFLV